MPLTRPLPTSMARLAAALLLGAAAPLPLAAQAKCAPGSWSATGRVPCTLASPGFYVSGVGATTQVAATLGHYVPTAGATKQLTAAKGWYVPTPHATQAIMASPGYYVPSAGAAAQIPAPPGTYVPGPGAWEVTKAQPGYYVPTAAATSQTPAPIGFYAPGSRMTAPRPAPPGFYVPTIASTTVTRCPAHTNAYGEAPACRFTGRTGPPVPGSIGPQFAASLAPGSTIDVGVIPLGSTLTLHEWLANVSGDLARLGAGTSTPVFELTALTVFGVSFNAVAPLRTTISGLTPDLVLGEGQSQPFDVTLRGAQTGRFDQLFTVLTDQSANFGDPGQSFSFRLTGSVAPEPTTLSMLGIGMMGLVAAYRRRLDVRAGADG